MEEQNLTQRVGQELEGASVPTRARVTPVTPVNPPPTTEVSSGWIDLPPLVAPRPVGPTRQVIIEVERQLATGRIELEMTRGVALGDQYAALAAQVGAEVQNLLDDDASSRPLKRALWDIIAIAGQAIRSHEDDGVAVATRIKDRAEQVMDDLLELASAGWTYCADRLPAKGEVVEVAMLGGVVAGILEEDGWWDATDWRFADEYGLKPLTDVYAWRPLPEPPPVREVAP